MDSEGQGPSRNAGKPDWFLHWLKEVFLPASRDPIKSQVKKFEDAVERIPDIDDAVKASLTNALTTETRVSLAREDDKPKISELVKTQLLPTQDSSSLMPWNQLTEAETKAVARALETLQQQDFSSKSLKHWTALFNDKFDRSFITSRVGRLALVYNSCSLSLKQRLIALDVGKHAQQDSYTFLHLLQLITTVVHSPVSRLRYTRVSSKLPERRFKPSCRGRETPGRMPGDLALDGPCPKHLSLLRKSAMDFCQANWPS